MATTEEIPRAMGPGILQPFMTPSLVWLRQEHQRYQSQLSHFQRYLIFKYTLQSWQMNGYLIGEVEPQDVVIWAREFFRQYNYPVYGWQNLDPIYRQRWQNLFREPEGFLPKTTSPRMLLAQPQLMERLLPVAKAVMEQYIQDFTAVVNGAPVPPLPFSAYKGSIPYPGVPKDQPLRHSVDVYQKPFNSTSYDPAFNYGAFIAEEEHWLLWNLQAPAGTHCLALSDLCHILPFEHEIVFPPGSTFRVTSSTITDMIYIRKEDWLNLGKPGGGLRQVQAVTDPPLLAPIYMLDMSYRPRLYQKKMHLLTADIVQEAV